MVTDFEVVHPFASVTVTVYVPAVNPVISSVVEALLHRYEYGIVPPPARTEALPVNSPKHKLLVPLADAVNNDGSVIRTSIV